MGSCGKFLVCIALAAWCCAGVSGQSFIHRNLTTADGLPSDYINHFYQDSKGYMWIATDRGVCRYDGRSFMRLTVDDGLPENMITCSYQDRKGNMWFGSFSDSGLSCWNGSRIVNYAIGRKGIKQIFFDSRNRVYYSDLTCFRSLQQDLPLPKSLVYVSNACQLSPDSFLIFYPGRIYLLDVSGPKPVVDSMPEPHAFTRGLALLAEKMVYVLGNNSLSAIETGGNWPFSVKTSETTSFYCNDALATDSSLLVAVGYGLLEYSLANRKFVKLAERYGLPAIVVNALRRDRNGNLWIGTYGKGIVICSNRTVVQSDDPNDRIVSIASAGGETWIATSINLFRYKQGRLIHQLKDPSYQISSLASISGQWWLSDYHFLYGPVPSPIQMLDHKAMHVPEGISGVCRGADGLLYTGTYGWGVIRSQNNRITDTLMPANGLCDDMVEKVFALKHGVAALSYSNGFSLVKPDGSITTFSKKNGLLSNTVYTVASCNDSLLVGTEGGLSIVYSGKVLTSFGKNEGFVGDKAMFFFKDRAGRQFILSDKCLHLLQQGNLSALRSYNLLAGADHILTTSLYDSTTNSLLVGTNHGLLELPMAAVAPDAALLPLALEAASAAGSLSLKPATTVLHASNNTVTFRFLAPYFLPEQAPFIHYRLTGYDTTWHTLNGDYAVTFPNLPSGTYRLEASLANADGFSTPLSTMYSFTVKPYWWRTGWFVLLVVLSAVSLTGLAVWDINRRRFRNRLALLQARQEQQDQRERISRELHDNVGSQLAFIAGNLDWISQPESPLTEEQRTQKLVELGVSTREVIDDLRESIWTLKNDKITTELLAQRLQQLAQKLAPATGSRALRVEQRITHSKVLDPSVALNMLRIAQEALHNALQHAQAKNIEVVIQSSSAGSVQITIADDGRGMADAERYKDNHYGFENMERRAADSALSLLVESAPGNGTRIVVATTS